MKLKAKHLISLIIILLALTPVAFAHGGGTPQLINEPAGPYRVYVWTNPTPLKEGKVHITVAVAYPVISPDGSEETALPVLEADVSLTFLPLSGKGQTFQAMATHEGADNRLNYETDVEIDSAGEWQVIVHINGEQGPAQTEFSLEVESASPIDWWLVGSLMVIAISLSIIIYSRKGRKHDPSGN